jgi:uncharacterized protein (DUF433 family)
MARKPIIVKTPGTLSGRSRIDGHRIAVSDVWLAYRRALEELVIPLILKDFPDLTREQVLAALCYAREHMSEIEGEFEEERKAYEMGDPIPAKGS